MTEVTDEERSKERGYDLLLHGRLGLEMLANSIQDEEVNDAYQSADMCELDDRYKGGSGQWTWWWTGWPWRLLIVRLALI